MSKPNLPEALYVALDLAPSYVIPLLCVGIFIFLQLIRMCISFGSKKAATVNLGILKLFSKMAVVIFGPPEGIFRYEAAPKEELDEHLGTQVVYIRRKKVSAPWVIMLGCYVLAFGLFAVMVFWDIFLLSESHDCDDTTIDCFADTDVINATSGPIDDCSQYETTGDINGTTTITCYTFTYAFGAALGAIGGLLIMIRTVMKVISAIFMWAYANSSDECKCCRCSFFCVLIFHFILILLIPFVLPVTFIALVVGFSSLSIPNIIQVFLFIITLFFGISFPWCFFIGDEDHNFISQSERAEDRTPITGVIENDETTPIKT